MLTRFTPMRLSIWKLDGASVVNSFNESESTMPVSSRLSTVQALISECSLLGLQTHNTFPQEVAYTKVAVNIIEVFSNKCRFETLDRPEMQHVE